MRVTRVIQAAFGSAPAAAALARSTWDQLFVAASLSAGRASGADYAGTALSAVGVSAVYCADKVIAEGMATLSRRVYSVDGPKREPAPSHPLQAVLDYPNPQMTGPTFWGAFAHCRNFYGYGLAEIVRTGDGRVAQLWPIHPAACSLTLDAGGDLVFRINRADGTSDVLTYDDVLYVPGHTPDGSIGFRLLQIARDTFSAGRMNQAFRKALFENGTRVSGVIQSPGKLSEAAFDNLRESWQALYGGAANAGKVPILEEGTTFSPFAGINGEQMQAAELAELQVVEVARYFNVSPVKLHQLGRATWSNLETLNRDFVTTTLRPFFTAVEYEADRKLILPSEQGRFVVEHDTAELLRGDTQARYSANNSAIASGWKTVNEVRAEEGLPPKPGGDVLRTPANLVAADDPKPSPTDPPAEAAA